MDFKNLHQRLRDFISSIFCRNGELLQYARTLGKGSL